MQFSNSATQATQRFRARWFKGAREMQEVRGHPAAEGLTSVTIVAQQGIIAGGIRHGLDASQHL